ncbi:surface protease GP63 [Trypanosoma cruzi]|nr:surface protease GP63 [Trypanosoma cruzi]
MTLKYFKKDGKIKCPTYGEVCTIAANGSSLVIPSALVGGQGDEQEEEAEESAVASGSPSPENTRPQLSPVASGASIEKEPPGASAAGVAGGGLHAGPRGDPGARTESGDNTQRRGRRPSSGSEGANRASGPDAFFFCAITRRGRCTSGGRPAGGLPSGDSQCLRACHSDSVRQQRRFSGDTRCVGTAGRQ